MTTQNNELKARLKSQKKLGVWIVKVRKAKGMTPAQLGRECDIERSNMAAIEGGRVNVTFHTLIRIVNALDMSLEEFFKEFEI